jgi:hypothetical protein
LHAIIDTDILIINIQVRSKMIKLESISFRLNNKSATFFSSLKAKGLLNEKDLSYDSKEHINDYYVFAPTDPRIIILKQPQAYRVPKEKPPFYYEICVNAHIIAELDWVEHYTENIAVRHIDMVLFFPTILDKALINSSVADSLIFELHNNLNESSAEENMASLSF